MIVSTIKKLLPRWLKVLVRRTVKFFKYRYRRFAISRPVSRGEKIKIIVGAAETFQDGWYSTNEQWLDITDPADWRRVFDGRCLITHVVAEHVFEHLSFDECRKALANISSHMVDGGRLRIAVPDGYHPDQDYLSHVGIDGIGDDAADHKQLLNVDVLFQLFREAGFEARHLEGYDSEGNLVRNGYSTDDGSIQRSRDNASPDSRNKWGFVDADTSLIVDGVKA